MDLKTEVKRGLRSGFNFECNMCGYKQTVWTEREDPSTLDVNTAAVAGSVNTGGGFSSLETVMGALNVRCMSSKTYIKHHTVVAKGWEESALQEMKAAAAEEMSLARQRGDVDKDNVPLLTVVADGSWAKRSYRKNYNSLSGVAAIVGYHTRKVLFFGVKNKYCVSCARSEKNKELKKNHVCFRNWSGSSSSMESAIIVEGFLMSEEMYGVRYARMIADGDSSVYHSILEARPYDNLTVEKIECRNHLLRNYCKKLKEISSTTLHQPRLNNPVLDRGTHLQLRRVIDGRIRRCRTAVTKAISHRKKETGNLATKSNLLSTDILNGPSHVFGEHRLCQSIGYFCNGPKDNEKNYVPELIKYGLYPKIMEAVDSLVSNSSHLILDVDSNMVEHYNSAVAKFTGGKRINFVQKNSYKVRCAAAVVSHNNGKPFYTLHKTLTKSSPGNYSKLYENRSKRKSSNAAQRNQTKPKARRSLSWKPQNPDHNYGPHAKKPDLDAESYERKKENFLQSLIKTEEERNKLEEDTRGQSQNFLWLEERRIRVTASNFGLVCNRKPHSSCAPVVSHILYSSFDSASVRYGRLYENTALNELEKMCDVEIKNCGLFIDSEFPFLAATPDGLIGDNGIVEIKCPSAGADLTPDEVINQKKGTVGSMWQKSGNSLSVKPKHGYNLQVQGQLHITKRDYCLFGIWTPLGLKVEKIERDDDLWQRYMKDKLISFFYNCLLPEIVDPRRRRSMPIREPDYILNAQREREEKSLAKPLKKRCI